MPEDYTCFSGWSQLDSVEFAHKNCCRYHKKCWAQPTIQLFTLIPLYTVIIYNPTFPCHPDVVPVRFWLFFLFVFFFRGSLISDLNLHLDVYLDLKLLVTISAGMVLPGKVNVLHVKTQELHNPTGSVTIVPLACFIQAFLLWESNQNETIRGEDIKYERLRNKTWYVSQEMLRTMRIYLQYNSCLVWTVNLIVFITTKWKYIKSRSFSLQLHCCIYQVCIKSRTMDQSLSDSIS